MENINIEKLQVVVNVDINDYYKNFNLNSFKNLELFGFKNTNYSELINILNEDNIEYSNDEVINNFKKHNIFLLHEGIFCNKYLLILFKNEKPFYYFRYPHNYFFSLIKIIKNNNFIPKNKKKIILYNGKFRPLFKSNPFNWRILGVCKKKGFYEKGFISYYLFSPFLLDNKEDQFKTYDLEKVIDIVYQKGQTNYSIPKAVFRGSINNNFRKELLNIATNNDNFIDFKENDYISFLNFSQYKYIIDLWGIDGHSGRRYYYMLLNRVIFLPKEDEAKLFFEIGKNPILPNVHYIEYSVNNMEEIVEKVKYLEQNKDEYERIRKNCNEYANKYLKYQHILEFIEKSIFK